MQEPWMSLNISVTVPMGNAKPSSTGVHFNAPHPGTEAADSPGTSAAGATRAARAARATRATRASAYWAPEVAQGDDERFYLYYSATTTRSDEDHRLRVAVADAPQGPFQDSGRLLFPDAGFTIDASPFRDPQTGRRYLYFAQDYT